MKWKNNIIDNLKWSDNIINREQKEKVAQKIARMVNDNDIIGIGSGSTSYLALLAISERVKAEKLHIQAIPTSQEISMACIQYGIPLTNLWDMQPDWSFDGADEVDSDYSLIKGRGGAMFKEKLLMHNSPKTYIVIDESKLVSRLGEKFPVPIEIFPASLSYVDKEIRALGAVDVSLRFAKGKDGPVITENGNLVIDAHFDYIEKTMEKEIKSITGVIESGLFINYNVEILVS